MLSKPYASNFETIKSWVGNRKHFINSLELSQYNLIRQVTFAMPVTIGKVHAEQWIQILLDVAINLAVYNFLKDF